MKKASSLSSSKVRDVHLKILQEEADGKGLFSDTPGWSQKAKRILKYVSRAPENGAELEVHKHFLALCRTEDTVSRSMLYFWTELLDDELKAYCLSGKVPEYKDELTEYELYIHWTPHFGMESNGLATLLKRFFSFVIKEFLFRAEAVHPTQVDELGRKAKDNGRSVQTLFALAANKHNLVFFYNPSLTLRQAASCLRERKSEWMIT